MKSRYGVRITLLVFAVMLSACGGSGSTPVAPSGEAGATTEQSAPQQQAAPTQVQPTATTMPQPTATPAPSPTPVPTATPQLAEVGTSRSNPLPLGSEFTGETWSITVSDVVRGQDAAQIIAAANQFNESPRQGFEYLIANVSLKNISATQDAQSASFATNLRVTGDNNIVYRPASVVPAQSLEGELFPDGVTEGQIVFEVPSDEQNLMFMIGEMMSFDSDATRFMAIDEGAVVVPDSSLQGIAPTNIGNRRDSPAQIGDTLIAGPWEFAIVETVRGDEAAELVAAANQFNDPVPDGQEYVVVKLKARFLGTEDPDQSESIDGTFLKIAGEKDVVYEWPSVVSPDPGLDATLFAGGVTEGWEVLSVSKDEQGLVVIFEPLFSFSGDETRYIAIP